MTRDCNQAGFRVRIPARQSTLMLAAAVAALWCAGPTTATAHEDNGKPPQTSAMSSVTMQTGMVSSVNSGQIRVNDTNYPLDAAVSVSDDEGHSRDLKAVVPETQILYHVHRGHIDQIVVVLPK